MEADTILVQKLVDLAVGVDKYTYPMQKNAPAPSGDYAAVKFIAMRRPGTDEVKYLNEGDDVVMRTKGLRVFKYKVLFRNDDEYAESLQDNLYSDEVQNFMRKNKIAVMKLEKLDNESLTLETEWEVRTGYVLIFNRVRVVDKTVTTIRNVDIDGKVDSLDCDVILREP